MENPKLYKKCNEEGFCRWLLERCQTELTFKGKKVTLKGLVKFNYLDLNTGENRGSIVFYTKGSEDSGMALNFCPFCGFSFYDLYNKGRRVGGGTLTFETDENRKVEDEYRTVLHPS